MPSLSEAIGALGTSFFVPGNVISEQAKTQAALQANADRLNSNVPSTIAIAQRNGLMSDGQARRTLQDMNSSLFLVGDSQRRLGEEIQTIIKDSAAAAPGVLADAVNSGTNSVAKNIFRAIPWWIWAILGVYTALQLATAINALRRG